MNVQSNERYRAKEQLITALLEGRTFQQANFGSQVPVKRAMAYRLLRAVRTQGTIALQDQRHGHPSSCVERFESGSKPLVGLLLTRLHPSSKRCFRSASA